MAGPGYQLCERPVKPAIRPHDRNRIFGKLAEVLPEQDIVAARGKLGRDAVFHAEYLGVPDQIGDVAVHLVVMGDHEAVAINLVGTGRAVIGVESIGLAVEPSPLGLKGICLTFQRDVIGDRPLETRERRRRRPAGDHRERRGPAGPHDGALDGDRGQPPAEEDRQPPEPGIGDEQVRSLPDHEHRHTGTGHRLPDQVQVRLGVRRHAQVRAEGREVRAVIAREAVAERRRDRPAFSVQMQILLHAVR